MSRKDNIKQHDSESRKMAIHLTSKFVKSIFDRETENRR